MKYEDRHTIFKDKIIISYPFRWGGQLKDRWMWMAELNGEVWDYNSKDILVQDAINNNKKFVVLKIHKNGSFSETPY